MPGTVKAGESYRCEKCGNVVEVKEAGSSAPVCCDQPMVKVEAKKGGTRRCCCRKSSSA